MSATERVYKSATGMHDNTAVFSVSIEGESTPLAGVTRITCDLQPADEEIDSDTSPNAITWTDAGVVTLDLAEHTFGTVPTGLQRCKLVAYDPSHTNGQVLAHRGGEDNQLTIIFNT